MSQAHFRVIYDGPALAAHEMDVRELAPALIAMGDLLDAATRVINAERAKAQVNVRGSFQTGSFGIDFAVAADWVAKVRDMLIAENATAVLNAAAMLGLLGLVVKAGHTGLHGVVGVLKWLRGRRIDRVEVLVNDHVRLHVEADHLDVERAVLALLRDLRVRRALEQVLAPLARDGIETFASGTDRDIAVTIERAERAWFDVPTPEDVLLLEETQKRAFSIVSLAFRDDNKWRLSDGAATIYVTISDAAFLARVEQNLETFAKGDLLICRIVARQWETAAGTRSEYEVLEVLEHRQAARQLPIPFEE
jgi:hypothetical protein